MAIVDWETTTGGIQPQSSESIVPNGTKDVGASGDRWGTAYVQNVNASIDLIVAESAVINNAKTPNAPEFTVYGDSSSSDVQVLIAGSTDHQRVFLAVSAMGSVSSDARTILAQENTSGAIPVAGFKQRDQDAPFVDFEGYGASDQSKNISTANGDGAVSGPKLKGNASYGWLYARMVKVRITEYGGEPFEVWIPAYVPDTH